MPELPEVEAIRRRLHDRLAGAAIVRATLHRRDVVRAPDGRRTGRIPKTLLGVGSKLSGLERRGKQLLVLFGDRGGLVVRLGMSGRLDLQPHPRRGSPPPHRHLTWTLETDRESRLILDFIDPRRFGGIHLGEDREELQRRLLARLGPDGTTVTRKALAERLARTRRAIKVAILDQNVLAGVGNIYADEALHAARIHPLQPAQTLRKEDVGRLAAAIRRILGIAIERGGTTLRDHRLPDGSDGGFARFLRVYGRGGDACGTCGTILENMVLNARGTTWCPSCQQSGLDASR